MPAEQPSGIVPMAAADNPKPLSAKLASASSSPLEVQAEPATPVPAPVEAVKREPLVDALQCVLDNRHHEALQLLQKYDQQAQEVFLRLLPILALMTQKSVDQMSPPEVAVLNEAVQSFSDSVRPHSRLSIDKACFCEWIKSFGIYKPLPEGHAFLGSTANRPGELVHLYFELRNFLSEAKNGVFATRLSSTVEIRDQKGEPVWRYRFEDEPISSRTLLHDHYSYYYFYVPNKLPPGTYNLFIHVTDKTRPDQPRMAISKPLEFRVTSMGGG